VYKQKRFKLTTYKILHFLTRRKD